MEGIAQAKSQPSAKADKAEKLKIIKAESMTSPPAAHNDDHDKEEDFEKVKKESEADSDIKQELGLDGETPDIASNTKRKRRRSCDIKKKPKDMPRRPLSAYNFFFGEERVRVLGERQAAESQSQPAASGNKPDPELFAAMGKTIASRWKKLSEEQRVRYDELAGKDMKRYRREMDIYQARKEKGEFDPPCVATRLPLNQDVTAHLCLPLQQPQTNPLVSDMRLAHDYRTAASNSAPNFAGSMISVSGSFPTMTDSEAQARFGNFGSGSNETQEMLLHGAASDVPYHGAFNRQLQQQGVNPYSFLAQQSAGQQEDGGDLPSMLSALNASPQWGVFSMHNTAPRSVFSSQQLQHQLRQQELQHQSGSQQDQQPMAQYLLQQHQFKQEEELQLQQQQQLLQDRQDQLLMHRLMEQQQQHRNRHLAFGMSQGNASALSLGGSFNSSQQQQVENGEQFTGNVDRLKQLQQQQRIKEEPGNEQTSSSVRDSSERKREQQLEMGSQYAMPSGMTMQQAFMNNGAGADPANSSSSSFARASLEQQRGSLSGDYISEYQLQMQLQRRQQQQQQQQQLFLMQQQHQQDPSARQELQFMTMPNSRGFLNLQQQQHYLQQQQQFQMFEVARDDEQY